MTEQDCKLVLAKLLAAFPTAKLDQASVLLYAEAIRAFPLDVVMTAVAELIASHDRFPSIAALKVQCSGVKVRFDRDAAAARRSLPDRTDYRQLGREGCQAARAALRKAKTQPDVNSAA